MKRKISDLINHKRNNFLLLDFCNLKGITHNAILELHKKHKIIHTKNGKNKGFEESCFSKQDPDKRMWFLFESKETISFRNDPLGISAILPSEKNGKVILRFLQKSQIEYKNFLDQCADGHLDLNFINKIMQNLRQIGLNFEKSNDEWNPYVTHGINYLPTFESYVDWEILNLFFLLAASVFERVRVCSWQKCERYFIFKRRDQKYCCPNCRDSMRNYRFRQTEGYKKYRKKSRVKGVYILVKDR